MSTAIHDADVVATAAAFDAMFGVDIAKRTLARIAALGLGASWCEADDCWHEAGTEGCIVKRGVFHHNRYIAHIDFQVLGDDGTEAIVRAIVSTLGQNGKLRSEVQVGAYVGGGKDHFGKVWPPRFLSNSANAPEVRAAHALFGLA